ncbi:acyl-CoA N-acyltransferase [Coniophora puteana RWD-64-598 SS2]|uniref:Histone acetyltransferase type B catalytic subunit n=1 Tax=Coniophora puteana (strain RWD-64-598) TaxID=741705 RepID=A0A5M3N293_CONPW|nr:acyl-CoA N-acyltransferase [Coniophora puteana RWD-64-598 SS2]EIW85488.1 acyl-CoA N-acyltransferase [Coniophora puteana RWD-64-598 SS2]
MSEDWTTDSNTALHLSLVRGSKDASVLAPNESYTDFHPTFTYPIYGEDEKIYGYKDLVIDLRFTSGSLAYFLSVRHSGKLTASNVDDPEATLQDFIPECEKDEKVFSYQVEKDAASFRPYGKCIYEYTRNIGGSEVEFEVYHATFATPGFKEYHQRMQLFILLYIEAGSYIDDEEDGWEFVVLYEKRKRTSSSGPGDVAYHFVGYSSLYNFYCYPEQVRMRLSQFVILPPFQRKGHGSELYASIRKYVLADPTIAELTVEDPAEAFEDLRDVCDLRELTADARFMDEAFSPAPLVTSETAPADEFAPLAEGESAPADASGKAPRQRTKVRPAPAGVPASMAASGSVGLKGKGKGKGRMGPPVDKAWAEKWRKDLKIAGRQFNRLVEMLILRQLEPADERAYRLHVKERLYRFNFEQLAQIEKQERLEKLEETYQSVKEDYMRILAGVRRV